MASTITLDEFAAHITRIGETEFGRRLTVALSTTALRAEAAAKSNATRRPRARTGRLASSIRGHVQTIGGSPAVVLQAGGPGSRGIVTYAGTQEFGATIKPTASDFLRIPLDPAKTAAGVDRFSGVPLRTVGDFFPFRSESGRLYLGRYGDTIGGGAPRAWYALVKSVKIKPTYFMRRAMETAIGKMEPDLRDLFRISLQGGST